MFCSRDVVVRVAQAFPGFWQTLAFTVAVVSTHLRSRPPSWRAAPHGTFRFGLPMSMGIGAVCETRWPPRALPTRSCSSSPVALASVWALEAFAYTLLTILAVIAVRVWRLPTGTRRTAASAQPGSDSAPRVWSPT